MASVTLLEIGNSTIKLARPTAGGGFTIERYGELEALLRDLSHDAGEIVCAPVGRALAADALPRLRERHTVRVVDRSHFRDFVGDSYDTPETLGLDRILNLAGMKGDGVAISCGTAITVDAVASGRPSWGGIMPGFRTAAEGLHARIPALPVASLDAGKQTVAFCNTGHWAATDWFALSEVLGRKNVKLYPGSMVDWTQAPQALPVANEPGRAQQLLIDAKLWAARNFH